MDQALKILFFRKQLLDKKTFTDDGILFPLKYKQYLCRRCQCGNPAVNTRDRHNRRIGHDLFRERGTRKVP